MLASVTSTLSDFETWLRTNGLEIVILVTGALLVGRVIAWVSHRLTSRIDERSTATDTLIRSESAKHRHAVTGVVTGVLLALLYFITAIFVLEKFDVPLAGLVAPAAVAGVGLGFGAQNMVQDFLAGFLIVSERQYGYGDLVRIATMSAAAVATGTVEEVTLRITRLRTINGEVVFVPNGQILTATNLSRDWARAVVDVPLPASADVSAVTTVLRKVCAEAFADATLRPLLLDEPSVMGVETISVDSFEVRVVARTLPGKQFEVSRDMRERISVALRVAGITVQNVVDETQG